MGVTIFKTLICGAISSAIRSEIMFKVRLTRRRETKFSTVECTCISDDIAPKIKILNIVTPHFFILLSLL